MADAWVTLLARRRVSLGFVTAAATYALAQPTWMTWQVGLAVAALGEALRIWAAGHLEKNREVTRSGPYRLTRHPLYVGSVVVATGAVIAARSVLVAVLVTAYLAVTLTAAIRTEEAFLRRTFGDAYDRIDPNVRTSPAVMFSLARVLRNREHRAVVGLLGAFGLLALKVGGSV